MNIDPNDPKLTAYALGELDEQQRIEVEAEMNQSEELRRAVDEIRKTAELLTNELAGEPTATLTVDQRQAIESKAVERNGQTPDGSDGDPHRSEGRGTDAPARREQSHRSLRSRLRTPLALAASVAIVVTAGYYSVPKLSRSRSGGPAVALNDGSRLDRSVSKRPARSRLDGGCYIGGLETVDFTGVKKISYGYEVPSGPRELLDVEGSVLKTGERFIDFDSKHFNTESYAPIVENPFVRVEPNKFSTFSIDVDTASYANVRRFLTQGRLPPPGAVRIEEMVNYFDYDYPIPDGDDPFSVNVEVADCPWNPDHLLARIGLKGWEIEADEREPANLVFLLDVSGSMSSPNKLPLVKKSMRMLVNELGPDDSVAIAVYAGASGLVLPSTACRSGGTIESALGRLNAGGSTNGGEGIQLAYDVAEDNFIEGGINRVILCTDGDFNVSVTNQSELVALIEEKAETGVFLSVLGFGMGNLKDSTLEQLADKGNGNYAYIDTLNEAHKVLVEQMGGTLVTIAKDVKIQIDFNPAEVSAYRLIGYENRLLRDQDFNDDTKDAGEIGAGHTVTALYELVPVGVEIDLPDIDPSKYETVAEASDEDDVEPADREAAFSDELFEVRLRYKQPDGDTSKLLNVPATDEGLTLADASDDFVFAASVASFGMLLRGSQYIEDFSYGAAAEMAEASMGRDVHGYRAEFVDMVRRAIELGSE